MKREKKKNHLARKERKKQCKGCCTCCYLFHLFATVVPPVLAGTATAFSDQFADLKSHPWGAAELTMMVQLGNMQGYPEGDRLYALPPDKQE